MDPLIEIHPDQVTATLKVFDPQMPTAIRCQAVLGVGAGRIFVDDAERLLGIRVGAG
jgi:hypothetical protein